jgi:Transposase DDE domain group 1
MKEVTTRQRVLFEGLLEKPVVVELDQPHGSSDGGAILLKACDDRLRLTERIAGCFRDERQLGKVKHTVHDLVRHRVYAMACGYEDCNDAARLSGDLIHKVTPLRERSW